MFRKSYDNTVENNFPTSSGCIKFTHFKESKAKLGSFRMMTVVD